MIWLYIIVQHIGMLMVNIYFSEEEKAVVRSAVLGAESDAQIAEDTGLSEGQVYHILRKKNIKAEIKEMRQVELIRLLKAHFVTNTMVAMAIQLKDIYEEPDNAARERLSAIKEYRKLVDEFVVDQKINEKFIEIQPKKFAMMEKAYRGTMDARDKVAEEGVEAVTTGAIREVAGDD